MPPNNRPSRPSGPGGQPRRLGPQAAPAKSAGAARRAARARGQRQAPLGWIAVGVVVVILAAFLIYRVTEKPSTPSTAGQSSGRDPVLASASSLDPIENIPASVFNAVGTDGQPAPFELTTTKKLLTSAGHVQFVYFGAEYCPYCALMRWSLIAALSRFGTFSNVKQTASSASDGDIPTFSFLGSKYTSPYLTFSSYEAEDRNRNALQTPPTYIEQIVSTYDAPPYVATADEGSIPFLDIGNTYVADGDPTMMADLFANGTLVDGGPGRQAIADGIHAPSSANGKLVGGALFIAEANYLSAAICLKNGEMPASVCQSSGVRAAAKLIGATKPTS